jgi:hypothetical protein
MLPKMIVSLHVASGAAAGALLGSRRRAAVVGAALHALGDRIPHQDIGSHWYETLSGGACLLAVAIVRGPLDPATIGAAASSTPDLEHILSLPRPGGRKLFPSHRVRGWHRAGGISASAQLLLAGFLLGAVLANRARPAPAPARGRG